ncbi:uncharacterized protein JCM15063_000085 [Sporobolomyces koalae]|uniref:uncharacterized protein n=1 Tax=Sporobolomyces koalae TaxID=500713 RepID=UPI00317459DC
MLPISLEIPPPWRHFPTCSQHRLKHKPIPSRQTTLNPMRSSKVALGPLRDDDSPPASKSSSPEPRARTDVTSSPALDQIPSSEPAPSLRRQSALGTPAGPATKRAATATPLKAGASKPVTSTSTTKQPSSSSTTPQRRTSTSPTLARNRSSPTQTRSTPNRTSSTSSTSASTPSTSPPRTRSLTSPTASSLAKTKPKIITTPSTSPTHARNSSPILTARTSPRIPSSTRMSPTNSRSGGPSHGTASPDTSRNPRQTGSASSSPALRGTSFETLNRKGDSSPPTPPSSQPAANVRKIAKKGRIGLAGAPVNSNPQPLKGEDEPRSRSGSDAQQTVDETVESREEPDSSNKTTEQEDIQVFKGFGADRPHGRIPIPMDTVIDPETGESKLVAKQP